MAKAKLTAKQALFIAEYFACGMNASEAARRAGYSEHTARVIGMENLTKPAIQQAIAKRQAERADRLQVTADQIAEELRRLGFSNMRNYLTATPDGDPVLDFSDLSEEETAALAEVTVDDYMDGRGEDAREVRRVKFKLYDKRAALVDLAKLLGLMPDRHEHSGPEGGPMIGRIERVIVKPGEQD